MFIVAGGLTSIPAMTAVVHHASAFAFTLALIGSLPLATPTQRSWLWEPLSLISRTEENRSCSTAHWQGYFQQSNRPVAE
jgi:hypothetical protein